MLFVLASRVTSLFAKLWDLNYVTKNLHSPCEEVTRRNNFVLAKRKTIYGACVSGRTPKMQSHTNWLFRRSKSVGTFPSGDNVWAIPDKTRNVSRKRIDERWRSFFVMIFLVVTYHIARNHTRIGFTYEILITFLRIKGRLLFVVWCLVLGVWCYVG